MGGAVGGVPQSAAIVSFNAEHVYVFVVAIQVEHAGPTIPPAQALRGYQNVFWKLFKSIASAPVLTVKPTCDLRQWTVRRF